MLALTFHTISHKYSFNWITKLLLHKRNVNSYFQRQGQREWTLYISFCFLIYRLLYLKNPTKNISMYLCIIYIADMRKKEVSKFTITLLLFLLFLLIIIVSADRLQAAIVLLHCNSINFCKKCLRVIYFQ